MASISMAGKIGVGLDDVPDVADQDEGWPAMFNRQRPSVVFRLAAGIQHQHVPGAACAAGATSGRFLAKQVRTTDRLGTARLARLFCLQHEAVLLIEIDPPATRRSVRGALSDRSLEHVVVFGGVGGGRVGPLDAQHVTEFEQEGCIVGAFLAALAPLPARPSQRAPASVR